MQSYRVAVYAIAKNEAQFAARWAASMREADEIYVLDTGSTDETAEILRSCGVHVTEEAITPWRFDTARNRSLELLPEDCDICVCTDLDEVFTPGWRAQIEAAWSQGATCVKYRYVWNYLPDGREGTVFWIEKIHARKGYRWRNPVHEILQYQGTLPERKRAASGVCLQHHADPNKSRGQYLPLLELSVEENPDDDRGMHYLGREYLFYGRYEDAIRTLKRHLAMPQSQWDAERCASMRFLAQAYIALGQRAEGIRWLLRAIAEAPQLREPYVELAMQLYLEENWAALAAACEAALAIRERPSIYINEPRAWGALPHDLASLAWYHLGNVKRALFHAKNALALSPEDRRIQENIRLFSLAGDEAI